MAWSFICPTEIRAFDRRIQEFEARTCAVVFCSTDSEYVLRAWNNTSEDEGGLGGVHVPLISDRSHRIARSYGVLLEDEGVAQRSMFIIDPRGTVRQVTTNDANVGRSVEEARRLLDALMFTDEFGEGCPVDWKRGEAGLDMGRGEKRNSIASSVATAKPRRPSHKRNNTWTGWLAKPQSVSVQGKEGPPIQSTLPSPRLQRGESMTMSMPQFNHAAMQHNGKSPHRQNVSS